MHKLLKPGRIIFAVGIIALGVLSIISKDFIVGRPPAWPANTQAYTLLAYALSIILIAAAMAVLLEKKPVAAAFVIAALIFLFSVLRHLPHFMADWLNTYKSLALFGGALIIAASFMNNALNSKKNILVLTGSILLAAFFIAAGYAHFKFADFVKDFIPAYIPLHSFFTYFCGICLFAGGIGLLIPGIQKWAALLSGIMLSIWFIFLHIPRFLSNVNDASDRMGVCESFAFAGIFFVLAAVFAERNGSKLKTAL